MTSILTRRAVALLAMTLIGATACSSSTDDDGGNTNGKCSVTLSGAETASLSCSAATAAWDATDNLTALGILPTGSPLVIVSFGLAGQPATKTYQDTEPGAVVAIAISDGTKGWVASVGGGEPTVGSVSLTITSLSTTVSTADGKVYAAHGTLTATLQPDSTTSATGTVTLRATF